MTDPTPPKMHPCRACAHPLRETWRYCPMCGQTRQHREAAWKRIPEECAARYRAGESLVPLAAEYGVPIQAMRRRLASLGVEIRRRGFGAGEHIRKIKRSPSGTATA